MERFASEVLSFINHMEPQALVVRAGGDDRRGSVVSEGHGVSVALLIAIFPLTSNEWVS